MVEKFESSRVSSLYVEIFGAFFYYYLEVETMPGRYALEGMQTTHLLSNVLLFSITHVRCLVNLLSHPYSKEQACLVVLIVTLIIQEIGAQIDKLTLLESF